MYMPSCEGSPSPGRAGRRPAPEHHEQGVGQPDELFEVGRDEQHRQPGRRASRSSSQIAAWAPTSTPRVGCAAINRDGSRSSPARRSASAGCRPTARRPGTSMPGCLDVELGRWPRSVAARDLAARSTARRCTGRVSSWPRIMFSHSGGTAAGPRAAGRTGCSRCRPRGGHGVDSGPRSVTAERDGAGGHGRRPRMASTSSLLAVALDPGDAEDLPAVDAEGDVVIRICVRRRRRREVATLELDDVGDGDSLGSGVGSSIRPSARRARVGRPRSGCTVGDRGAAADHGDVVGDLREPRRACGR